MFDVFYDHPGLLFVVATLLPIASFLLLLLAGGARNFLRGYRASSPAADAVFHLLGGEVTGRGPAYIALGAMALAFVFSFVGFVTYLQEHQTNEERLSANASLWHIAEDKYHHASDAEQAKVGRELKALRDEREEIEGRWAGSVVWASVLPASQNDDQSAAKDAGDEEQSSLYKPTKKASVLRVGYYIDMLSAIMFVMVTFVGTLIHLFSMGYMDDELKTRVEDHEVHTAHGHYHRRGRFGRFFLFLSLFCFSMLNLILADNLFQVFVSWELVGVCSYLLVGFYFERTSASNAANKAFITNRIGDAGFIIGLLILWTYVGTLNFQDVFQRVRCPEHATHGAEAAQGQIKEADRIVRADVKEQTPDGYKLVVKQPDEPGAFAILFPRDRGHLVYRGPDSTVTTHMLPKPNQYGYIPYWLLVVAGLGVFLGCVGKSAQFPLHVWLPDAMEGPTPVSALIHAATMVAAGVYLVGRCYPLFTPEVLLTIAYTGAITIFVAASIAVVMTDIKKVLAYSTVSQLGYMMLGLGVGGWAAGLFHLLTHAFFKALLFLGSGSVIYGCHHVQEMPRMGGLFAKMKITALTMLVGCFAIAGIPLFSGWYSKDAILASALGFVSVNPHHSLLFLVPLATAGLTTFYMFRMWFLTFTGKPRDHHVYEHAHETPWMLTVPLVLLAFFSVILAWGWPMWDPEASWLEHQLHHAQPRSVAADFGPVHEMHGEGEAAAGAHAHAAAVKEPLHEGAAEHSATVLSEAHRYHSLAGYLALAMVACGLVFAFALYYFPVLDPHEARQQVPAVYNFLLHKWYFDELYSAILVRPGLAVANWARSFDINVIDGFVHLIARIGVFSAWLSGQVDRYVIDGLANLLANVSYGIGGWLRGFQTGYLRSYVLFLVIAAVSIWVVLSFLLGTPATGTP
jgi:NADH-quinone oxidoreductase subunit L